MKILNLFPLTILQDNIIIDENERQDLAYEITEMQKINNQNKKSSFAWTGDTKVRVFVQ